MSKNIHRLTEKQCSDIYVGEPITLTTVMAVIAVALVAVIIYRLFLSGEGSATIPGGWKFSWE